MKMATVTEHTNIFAALTPQKYGISGLQRLQDRLFKITSPAGWCYRERGWRRSKADSGFSKMGRLCSPGSLLNCSFESNLKVLTVKSTFPQQ